MIVLQLVLQHIVVTLCLYLWSVGNGFIYSLSYLLRAGDGYCTISADSVCLVCRVQLKGSRAILSVFVGIYYLGLALDISTADGMAL
jgi:hypothetical protein